MRTRLVIVFFALALPAALAFGQCPQSVPVEGAPPPGPLPLFPADNWWNADISSAPVDSNSAAYIAFINNGGVRKLHPDFGGEVSPGSVDVYGMPYAIVDGNQPKQAVTFQDWDESDGVDYSTGQGVAFYPIPAEAITQPHWIEGGAPGSVDQRSQSDRHLLIIDCTQNSLFELYNVFYSTAQGQWLAGSGAFFDMSTNSHRPDGWTSADAAGLAILPGLVRYDEAWNSALTEIGHAFRVTVRATNGYVCPASHRAGSTAGALRMGARLRLKTSVNGQDPALRTSDPGVQKIFRAMQKHGLIVADNGSDMYITGTFDTRWDNDILNPAFSLLSASDFDVIQPGWQPGTSAPALASVGANPNPVVGGSASTGTVTLTGAAGSNGVPVTLSSANSVVATVPPSVTVGSGATSATFGITTSAVTTQTLVTVSATYGAATRTTTLTITPAAPPALASLTLQPTSIRGGGYVTATVTLSAPASASTTVALASSKSSVASVPASVVIAAGTTSRSFSVSTSALGDDLRELRRRRQERESRGDATIARQSILLLAVAGVARRRARCRASAAHEPLARDRPGAGAASCARSFAFRQNARVNVENDSARQRFLVQLPEGTGELQYRRIPPRTLDLIHTEVAPTLRGHGVGDALAEAAVAFARAEKLSIVATCPFVRRWLGKHPEHGDLVAVGSR